MDSRVENRRWDLVIVLLVACVLTLPWLDRPFYSRGEPREAIVAQSMLATGNWISPPAYNGAVPSKPPFLHWLIALSSLPGGEVTEMTSRIPSAIAFIIFSAALFTFVAKRLNRDTALVAVAILLSCSEWLRAGVTTRVDTLLSTAIAGGLLALFAWRERGYRGFPFLAVGLIAIAGLTKGPVGIVLPVAIFSLFELISAPAMGRAVIGIVARAMIVAIPALAIVSTWYVAGYLERGEAFIDKIWYENVARFSSTMEDEPHKHSVFYLVAVFLIGLLPWTIVWGRGLIAARGSLRGGPRLIRAWWRGANDLTRFSALAALSIFLFFCIPSSKRSVYLLPAFPFVAIVAAQSFVVWGSAQEGLLRSIAKIIRGFAFFVAFVAVVCAVIPIHPKVSFLGHALVTSCSLWRMLCLVILVATIALIRRGRPRSSVSSFAPSFVVGFVLLSLLVVEPVLGQLSPREWLLSSLRDQVGEGRALYSFGSEAYSSSFYLNKPFRSAQGSLPVGSWVFLEKRDLERFQREVGSPFHQVSEWSSGLEGKRRAVVVVEIEATDKGM